MPHVVLEVPVALVAGLRETVLLQYRATVEALHLGLEDELAGDAEASGGRERLRQLDELLDQPTRRRDRRHPRRAWRPRPTCSATPCTAR